MLLGGVDDAPVKDSSRLLRFSRLVWKVTGVGEAGAGKSLSIRCSLFWLSSILVSSLIFSAFLNISGETGGSSLLGWLGFHFSAKSFSTSSSTMSISRVETDASSSPSLSLSLMLHSSASSVGLLLVPKRVLVDVVCPLLFVFTFVE